MNETVRILLVAIFVSGLASGVTGAGPVAVLSFESAEMEQRFKTLSEELRCLVCQNQSLADSNAELARDLRKEVYDMLSDGSTDDEIIGFMVKRYGDFVLYRPPMKPLTWVLWFGPAILLFAGFFAAFRIIKKQAGLAEKPLTEDEQKQLQAHSSEPDNAP